MRKPANSRWLLLVALFVSATPSLAVADANQPEIDWRAPAACPDAATFATQVARYLGSSSAGARVRVVVEITKDKRGFHLVWHMWTPEGEGERSLDGEECGLLAETAALAFALAIDPHAEEGVDEAAIFAADDDERPPTHLEPVIPFPEIRRPRRPGLLLGFAMRITAGGDSGGLPGFAPSIGGAVAARSGPLRVEIAGNYWFSNRHTIPDNPTTGGDFDMWAFGFRACGDVLHRFGTWSVCLGGEAGRMEGTGFGVDVPETNASGWFAGTGALAGSWKLANHLFLRTDLQGVVRKDRPRFVLTGVLAHQPRTLNVRLFTGLELQIR